jgi:enoyl-CoA hydratase
MRDFVTDTPAIISGECLIRREGRAGRITLNRPEALNALTLGMVHDIAKALVAWRSDAKVEVVVLDGAGDRAFCAGGDVVAFYHASAKGTAPQAGFGRGFWRDEYHLNAAIHRYPKPFVAIMDGIVMGGGVGLSAHSRHRIVTEKTMVAMPETTIGLVPDVGGTYLLGKAQGRFGEYLGLTGARMTGSDAIQAGFADTFVSRANISALVAQLCEGAAGQVEDLIEEASEPVPQSTLSAARELITKIFAEESVERIADAALRSADPIAQKVRADLQTRSPLALKVTLEAVRRARKLSSLEEALNTEFRLTTRLYENGEFVEGIRALLIDKDKAPKWQPPALADVTSDLVASYFAPLLADEELNLKASA